VEGGIAELPDDFDWSYFQAAPRDQRLDRLRGDEWLMLEGLHRTSPRLRVRIPKARGLARIYQQKNVNAPPLLELVCDTLHIEPDADRCSLIWRADFVVASELAASALVIAGAVVEGHSEVCWPESIEALDGIASPAQGAKAWAEPPGEPGLYSTALSPGVAPARGAETSSPPPPRHLTPPPPLPPAPVPPPPDWQKVARPSWDEFPAVSDPVGIPPEGVGSGVLSDAHSSRAYPSYPGMAAAHPPYDVPSFQPWPGSAPAAETQAIASEGRSPTGTIPAPPPDDEASGGFDQTAWMPDTPPPENRWEKTDPLVDEPDEDEASEWTRTRVADKEP
jgi:hypothetical protein